MLDDSIELVKLVAGCRSKPDKPCLFSYFKGHFGLIDIDMHADVVGPGYALLRHRDVVLALVIEAETLYFLTNLIVYA